jgi:hypothetical protein
MSSKKGDRWERHYRNALDADDAEDDLDDYERVGIDDVEFVRHFTSVRMPASGGGSKQDLDPTGRGCRFTIYLNSDFAEALKSLSVPKRQENTKESLSKMMEGMMSNLKFSDDSYLLTNITVAGQSTGLDFYRERNEYEYHTHNVDTASEAMEIIAIFAKWVEYAHLVLKDDFSKEKQNE